jgi:hypothetical protein
LPDVEVDSIARLLTEAVESLDDSVVGPKTDERKSEERTLGDLLYANNAKFRVPEEDWLALVRSIAAGDQLALHSLYEQTHRIVFTLIARITKDRDTAEELTIDVFYDVWRRRLRTIQ